MSEITKLYENAGVSKEPAIIPSSGEVIYWKNYPPFTAEKQIELIKWLSKECSYKITLNFVSDEHRITIDKHRELGKFCQKCDGCFEQALAGLINNIWQSLTEEEKQQVKGILE